MLDATFGVVGEGISKFSNVAFQFVDFNKIILICQSERVLAHDPLNVNIGNNRSMVTIKKEFAGLGLIRQE